MAEVYWLSFRIKDDDVYQRRSHTRLKALEFIVQESCANKWWAETTSFFVFDSNDEIEKISHKIKHVIKPNWDTVILCQPDNRVGHIIGRHDDPDILTLMPYLEIFEPDGPE